jgi:predicted enzyme related to lactoylglutathione lyase
MGNPVFHFEVTGKDGAKLASFFSELFGWQIDTNNLLSYGTIPREQNLGDDGGGIGGSVGQAPDGSPGQVTFYVGVPDIEASLAKAANLGGTPLFGPAEVPGTPIVLGHFTDPEVHVIGLMQGATVPK